MPRTILSLIVCAALGFGFPGRSAHGEGRIRRAMEAIHRVFFGKQLVQPHSITTASAHDAPLTVHDIPANTHGVNGQQERKLYVPVNLREGASDHKIAPRGNAEGKPHFYMQSSGVADPKILFLHGSGQNAENEVAARLVAGFREAGKKLTFVSMPWQIGENRAELEKYISGAAPNSLVIGGHSAGADHALSLMEKFPDRFVSGFAINPTGSPRSSRAVPLLLIRGENDYNSAAAGQEVRAALQSALSNVGLFLAEQGDHSLRYRKGGETDKDRAAVSAETKILNLMTAQAISEFVAAKGVARFELPSQVRPGNRVLLERFAEKTKPKMDSLDSDKRPWHRYTQPGNGGTTSSWEDRDYTPDYGYGRKEYFGHDNNKPVYTPPSYKPEPAKRPVVAELPKDVQSQISWTLELFDKFVETLPQHEHESVRDEQYRRIASAIGRRLTERDKSAGYATQDRVNSTHSIVNKVFRGGQPGEWAIERFATEGGQDPSRVAVINLRYESDLDSINAERASAKSPLKKVYMRHLRIVDHGAPTIEQVVEVLKIVSDPAYDKVLVHCKAGRSRTGQMIAAIRIAIDGWPLERALEEAERNGMRRAVQKAFVTRFYEMWRAGEIPFTTPKSSPVAVKKDDSRKVPSTSPRDGADKTSSSTGAAREKTLSMGAGLKEMGVELDVLPRAKKRPSPGAEKKKRGSRGQKRR